MPREVVLDYVRKQAEQDRGGKAASIMCLCMYMCVCVYKWMHMCMCVYMHVEAT